MDNSAWCLWDTTYNHLNWPNTFMIELRSMQTVKWFSYLLASYFLATCLFSIVLLLLYIYIAARILVHGLIFFTTYIEPVNCRPWAFILSYSPTLSTFLTFFVMLVKGSHFENDFYWKENLHLASWSLQADEKYT